MSDFLVGQRVRIKRAGVPPKLEEFAGRVGRVDGESGPFVLVVVEVPGIIGGGLEAQLEVLPKFLEPVKPSP